MNCELKSIAIENILKSTSVFLSSNDYLKNIPVDLSPSVSSKIASSSSLTGIG